MKYPIDEKQIVVYLGVFTKPVNLRLPFVLKRSPEAMHAFVKKGELGDVEPSEPPMPPGKTRHDNIQIQIGFPISKVG